MHKKITFLITVFLFFISCQRDILESKGESALQSTAEELMTSDPVCTRVDALATEALRLMEERHITSLPVINDEQRPEGVVHLHDLWRTEMI